MGRQASSLSEQREAMIKSGDVEVRRQASARCRWRSTWGVLPRFTAMQVCQFVALAIVTVSPGHVVIVLDIRGCQAGRRGCLLVLGDHSR
jgi:hypothetical protein